MARLKIIGGYHDGWTVTDRGAVISLPEREARVNMREEIVVTSSRVMHEYRREKMGWNEDGHVTYLELYIPKHWKMIDALKHMVQA